MSERQKQIDEAAAAQFNKPQLLQHLSYWKLGAKWSDANPDNDTTQAFFDRGFTKAVTAYETLHVPAAVKAERERCAKIAQDYAERNRRGESSVDDNQAWIAAYHRIAGENIAREILMPAVEA